MNLDYEVARTKRDMLIRKNNDIYTSKIIVGQETLLFEEMKFYDERLSIMLPNNYKDLPDEIKKIKYPMENRPEIIKSNESGDVNFAIALHDVKIKAEDIDNAMQKYIAVIYKSYPGTTFLQTESVPMNGTMLGYFSFITRSIDSDIYQVFAFTELNGKMLQIIFNAPSTMKKEWSFIILQVLTSIKIL